MPQSVHYNCEAFRMDLILKNNVHLYQFETVGFVGGTFARNCIGRNRLQLFLEKVWLSYDRVIHWAVSLCFLYSLTSFDS